MGLKVVSREKWGARRAGPLTAQKPTASSIVFVHHSAGAGNAIDTFAEQCAAMRDIQRFHIDGHGWSDIGYSYVVFQPQGRLHRARAFEGRTFGKVPAAQLGYNTGNGAICVVGNFQTESVRRNTRYAIEELAKRFPGQFIGGHRDVNDTSCPGDHLYAQLTRIAQASGKTRIRRDR